MGLARCKPCKALCCRYFALPIDKPETAGDFDDLRWYLMHKGVSIFVEDGDWYIQIDNRCKHLQADYRCAIYENRPRICRQYSTANCEYYGGEYDYEHLFKTEEELEAYARAYLRERRARARKRRARAKTRTTPRRNRKR